MNNYIKCGDLAALKLDLEIIISGELQAATEAGRTGNAVYAAGQLAMLERFWERILFLIGESRKKSML